MTWFKVDDGFWSHPKIAGLSDSAVATWVRAGSYSCQHLTDGFISAPMLRMFGDADTAAELVATGLWDAVAGGWHFHDWAEYQETGDVVRKRREQARERQRRSRERREQKRARGLVADSVATADVTRDGFVSDAEPATNADTTTGGPDTADTTAASNPQVEDFVASDVTRDTTREFSTPDPTVGRVGTTSLPSLPKSPNGDLEGPRKRGTRLHEDWMPRQDTIDWAKANHPTVDLRTEHEKFGNHWLAKSGRDAVKLDWDRTWRNWIIRAAEHAPGRAPAVSGMSRREQKIASAERFKVNPNPELLRRAGFDTRPGLTALPGGIQ